MHHQPGALPVQRADEAGIPGLGNDDVGQAASVHHGAAGVADKARGLRKAVPGGAITAKRVSPARGKLPATTDPRTLTRSRIAAGRKSFHRARPAVSLVCGCAKRAGETWVMPSSACAIRSLSGMGSANSTTHQITPAHARRGAVHSQNRRPYSRYRPPGTGPMQRQTPYGSIHNNVR